MLPNKKTMKKNEWIFLQLKHHAYKKTLGIKIQTDKFQNKPVLFFLKDLVIPRRQVKKQSLSVHLSRIPAHYSLFILVNKSIQFSLKEYFKEIHHWFLKNINTFVVVVVFAEAFLVLFYFISCSKVNQQPSFSVYKTTFKSIEISQNKSQAEIVSDFLLKQNINYKTLNLLQIHSWRVNLYFI